MLETFIKILIAKLTSFLSPDLASSVSKCAADVDVEIANIAEQTKLLNTDFVLKLKGCGNRAKYRIVYEGVVAPGVYWRRLCKEGRTRYKVSAKTHKTVLLTRCETQSEELKGLLIEFEKDVIDLRVRLAPLVALRKALAALS